ncbi:recombinase RecT [Brevibacillus sp. 1238]|uniref:recombinase RecT n=1 Tax=Brevibacillus sp. 1238 TaxID=2940565 RepID=UPI002475F289|nr:recombinase RecT [Brevibacillus sp. 1238]MDH6351890.1 recombination protein RecT [Brevibacillus sp. 1238]
MGNPQDMATKLAGRSAQATPALKPEQQISALLKRMESEIARAMPKHLTPDRLGRIALTAIRQTPKLLQCDQMSLLAAVMQSAQLGLEPNTPLGEAYLIPYRNKKEVNGNEIWVDEAQFQIGYKGIIALAHRTGEYQAIYAHEVYKNDKFEFAYGLDKNLTHVPADVPEGEPTHYYAVYKLKNGGFDFVVWSTKKIDAHAKRFSKAYAKGWNTPWKTDFPAMAKKTVLKEVLKYAPKSAELAKALIMDETVKHEISDDMSSVPWINVDAYPVEIATENSDSQKQGEEGTDLFSQG